MRIFSKSITTVALFGIVMLFSGRTMLLAAELPGGLDGANNLRVAWRIACPSLSTGEQECFLGLCDEDFRPASEAFPPPSPGRDDRLAFRYGSQYFTTIALRAKNDASYPRDWTIVVSSQDSDTCTLVATRVAGALPDGITLKLYDADGNILADWSTVTENAIASVVVAPGEYRISAECTRRYYTASVSVTLMPGWNLVASPFLRLESAKISGRDLDAEISLFRPKNTGRAVEKLHDLSGIGASEVFWIFHSGASSATLELSGKALAGGESAFAEHGVHSGEAFAGVVAAYDETNSALYAPTSELPDNAWRWDATRHRFRPATGTAVLAEGFVLR